MRNFKSFVEFIGKKKATQLSGSFLNDGCILLFWHLVSQALFSPMEGLTSEFEMVSGISPPLTTHPKMDISSLSLLQQSQNRIRKYFWTHTNYKSKTTI